MSYFQRIRPDCRIQSCTSGTQEKIDCFSADGFCGHCNILFQGRGCFYLYCPCQEARPVPIEQDNQLGTKKKKLDELRRQYIEDKGYTVVEMWENE